MIFSALLAVLLYTCSRACSGAAAMHCILRPLAIWPAFAGRLHRSAAGALPRKGDGVRMGCLPWAAALRHGKAGGPHVLQALPEAGRDGSVCCRTTIPAV